MGGSYAFSVIGYQGIACGAGDTQDCRFSTSVKYRVNIGQLRAAALWQFGGYSQNNCSDRPHHFQNRGGELLPPYGSILLLRVLSPASGPPGRLHPRPPPPPFPRTP